MYDNGLGGSFSNLVGSSIDYTSTTYIVTTVTVGTSYQFKVRAKNIWGWGPYSTVTTLTPSTAPS